MCGRFTLTTPPEMVAELFELAESPELRPRYNIAPTQPVPVVRRDQTGPPRRLSLLRWGLVPGWANDPSIGSRMINARAETVAIKPAYRAAFRKRRCLVIADGFYEWSKLPGSKGKQPHYIRMRDGGPFAFAGLWERWTGPDRAVIDSCTLLTTAPNELIETLHNRMPAILGPRDYDAWLDPAAQRLEALLRPYPSDEMVASPVGTLVNDPANDTRACIAPPGPRRASPEETGQQHGPVAAKRCSGEAPPRLAK